MKEEVVIPPSFKGAPVIYIDDMALGEMEKLRSVVIPSSIRFISHYAFLNSDNLSSIKVDPKNRVYRLEGNCLLSKNGKILYRGLYNSIIPSSVEKIEPYAFCGCEKLSSLSLPGTTKKIGHHAFYCCYHLGSIVLPSSIEEINNNAFE